MKVTVKERQKEENHEVPFDEISAGYVYKVFDDAVLLKVDSTNAVLLKRCGGCDYLGIAHDYKNFPAVKILGKLTEVIVEEV